MICAGDLSMEVAGPWKGASGHIRLVREHWSAVAANQRRTVGVRMDSGYAVAGFLDEGQYELAGHNSMNVVPRTV